MIKQLTNPTYSYQAGAAATVSCTLNILADDGVTMLASTGLSYTADLTRPDFRALISGELARQAQAYIDQLKVVAGLVFNQFGTPDFEQAVAMVLDDATNMIEV